MYCIYFKRFYCILLWLCFLLAAGYIFIYDKLPSFLPSFFTYLFTYLLKHSEVFSLMANF